MARRAAVPRGFGETASAAIKGNVCRFEPVEIIIVPRVHLYDGPLNLESRSHDGAALHAG